jgi:hypothetical protein
MEVGLEVNAEKTKYMLLSRHQNAGRNHDTKLANRCFENVAQFKYLGITVANQHSIQEEIKRRLNSGNACYYSVQNLLSSHLLFKNVRIRIYKTIILRMVLYGCETWSLILRGENGLRVFENRTLRGIFGPKRDEVVGSWRKLHTEEIHNLSSSPIRMSKSRGMELAGYVACTGRRGMRTGVWWESQKERHQ